MSVPTPASHDSVAVAKSYGEVGHIPDALLRSLASTFEGKAVPNPHDVAEAIVKLVGQSKGSRAVCTVVGAPFGSDKANEDVALCRPWSRRWASAISKESPELPATGQPNCASK